jgi:hypothetical protein
MIEALYRGSDGFRSDYWLDEVGTIFYTHVVNQQMHTDKIGRFCYRHQGALEEY